MRFDPLLRLFLVYPSGGSKGTQTTVQQNYSPEEAAARARVMAQAEAIFGKESVRQPTYPGAQPVAASADTLAAQEQLRQFSTGQGAQVASQAGEALKFGLGDVLYPETNPALQATIGTATRKVGEAFTDPGGVLSQIRSNFATTAPGGQSSREAIAMGLAGRGYLDTIGDVTGRLASEGYRAGLDTFGRTLAFSPNVYNLMTQPAVTQSAVGQQTEAYQQAQEDFAAGGRAFDINAPWSQLQNYANIVFGGSSAGTTTDARGPGVTGTQRAGMALAGASIGAYAAAGTSMGGPYGAAAGAAIGLLMSYL